jgi:hypothetical protein
MSPIKLSRTYLSASIGYPIILIAYYYVYETYVSDILVFLPSDTWKDIYPVIILPFTISIIMLLWGVLLWLKLRSEINVKRQLLWGIITSVAILIFFIFAWFDYREPMFPDLREPEVPAADLLKYGIHP